MEIHLFQRKIRTLHSRRMFEPAFLRSLQSIWNISKNTPPWGVLVLACISCLFLSNSCCHSNEFRVDFESSKKDGGEATQQQHIFVSSTHGESTSWTSSVEIHSILEVLDVDTFLYVISSSAFTTSPPSTMELIGLHTLENILLKRRFGIYTSVSVPMKFTRNGNWKHNTFAFWLATFECENSWKDSEATQMVRIKHQSLLLFGCYSPARWWFQPIPIPSMYGIFTYIWLFLIVKYGKCR